MKTIGSSRRMMTGILSAVFCETLFGLSYVFTRHAVGTVSPLALLRGVLLRRLRLCQS